MRRERGRLVGVGVDDLHEVGAEATDRGRHPPSSYPEPRMISTNQFSSGELITRQDGAITGVRGCAPLRGEGRASVRAAGDGGVRADQEVGQDLRPCAAENGGSRVGVTCEDAPPSGSPRPGRPRQGRASVSRRLKRGAISARTTGSGSTALERRLSGGERPVQPASSSVRRRAGRCCSRDGMRALGIRPRSGAVAIELEAHRRSPADTERLPPPRAGW